MQKENQSIILAILTGSLFVILFGFITFMVVVNYVKRKRKMLEDRNLVVRIDKSLIVLKSFH